MNYFFSVNNNEYKSELTIPKFKNKSLPSSKLNLYSLIADQSRWILEEVKTDQDKEFFYLNSNLSNDKIYFISENKDFKFNESNLEVIDNFTDTEPAFRSNLLIKNQEGGFSSYQSEYPFNMTAKSGMIISSVSSIANKDADKNYLFFRNIYYEPIEKEYEGFFINIKSRKVIKKIKIISNYSNFFEISEELINPEIFFVTKNLLGIPMYISLKNKHLSFEHTHPLHEYILSKNRFTKVKNFKENINEIIN